MKPGDIDHLADRLHTCYTIVPEKFSVHGIVSGIRSRMSRRRRGSRCGVA